MQLKEEIFYYTRPTKNFHLHPKKFTEASTDPSVKKISITIYRLSKLSSVANA